METPDAAGLAALWPRLEALVARREIEDVLLRYCRGIDRLDLELVRSCYHPDAEDEHGSFAGGVEAYLSWVEKLLRSYERTMHYLSNIAVQIEGDAAAVESYGVSLHESRDPAAAKNLVTGFRFLDRFERRGGEWRIAHRTAVTEWSRVAGEAGRFPVSPKLRRGERGSGDALYQLLAEVADGQ